MGIMAGPDLQAFLHATTSVKGFFHAAWRVAFHILDLITYRQGMQLVNGTGADRPAGPVGRRPRRAAVVELARDAADDRGRRASPARCSPHRTARSRCAPGGASCSPPGGFPHDVDRRRAAVPAHPDRPGALDARAAGDHRRRGHLGESAGGRVRHALASPAAWCPVSLVPYRNGRVGTYPHIVDRGKPGLIAVLSTGRRFVNEADGYYQFTSAMIAAAPADEEVAAWLICDHASSAATRSGCPSRSRCRCGPTCGRAT